jgi:hypothetical protein
MARGGKRPGAGRPPLAKNKIPMAAKEMIAQVADGLGGYERMLEWVQRDPANEKAFWTAIYPKLLPLQLSGEGGGPIEYRDASQLTDDQLASIASGSRK